MATQTMRNSAAFWSETWSLAMQALRANKMRAVLTMLGVIIGSGSIVLVVTIALGGQRYVLSQIEGIGANLVSARVVNPGDAGTLTMEDQISPADLDAIKQAMPQMVAEASGTNELPMGVILNGQERPITLVGVTQGFDRIRNFAILGGRYFDSDDMDSRSKVCLLTEDLAKRAFPFDDPDGKDIRVGELQFTVIGVVKERAAAFAQSEIRKESVIVPFSLLQYYTGTSYFRTLDVMADRSEDIPQVTSEVSEILRSRHRAATRYRVENSTGILETAREIALALMVVLILVALIALVISGVGIMNIMLVTVTERTREIGIRKAIGATQDAIRYQFLMEAMAISGTGALAGIAIGVAIPVVLGLLIRFIPGADDITVPVSWVSVVVAFVVSCSTGLIFGYLPANRAARLEPTESLRHE
jgi:putative ABC transport system permease protein